MSRTAVVAAVAALVCGFVTATAFGQLSLPILGGTVTTTPSLTVAGVTIPPLTVSVPTTTTTTTTTPATTTTTTTTTPISGVTDTVTSVVGSLLGTLGSTTGSGSGSGSGSGAGSGAGGGAGSGATTLPAAQVDALVAGLLGGGSTATGGAGAPATGTGTTPGAAPTLGLTVLSKLRTAARTGRLRLRVRASEPAVVAFTSMLRAGRARRVGGRTLHVAHGVVHLKPVVLAFHTAGTQQVTLAVAPRWRASLAHAKSARLAVQVWAADLARQQTRKSLKRTIRH